MQKKISKILFLILGAGILCLSVLGKNFWWTGLFGFIPLLYVLTKNTINNQKPIRNNILSCGLYGIIFYGFSFNWLFDFGWYTWLCVSLLQTLFLILFGCLFHFFVLPKENNSPASQTIRFLFLTLGVALLWTSINYLRSLGVFGFSWYSIYHLMAYNRPLIQYISYTGCYFLDFVVISFNMCVLCLILKKDKTIQIGITEEFLAFMGILIFLVMHISALGFLTSPLSGQYKAGICQGSLDMWEKTEIETLETYTNLTNQIKDKTDIIIMPETCFTFLDKNDFFTKKLEKIAKEKQTPIIVGANTASEEMGDYNSAILLSKNGVWMNKQNKIRLVPYGEYVPKILPIKFVNMREIDAVPGKEIVPLKLSDTNIKIACGICYDSSFPDFFREAGKTCNVFSVIAVDWWFGKWFAPENHFMMSVLRAVENRRYVLRCGSSGISGIITPYGEPLQRTKLDEKTVITDYFGTVNEVTLYGKYGKYYPYIIGFLWVFIGFFLIFLRLGKDEKNIS